MEHGISLAVTKTPVCNHAAIIRSKEYRGHLLVRAAILQDPPMISSSSQMQRLFGRGPCLANPQLATLRGEPALVSYLAHIRRLV